jgi:hypothetical protein
MVRIVKECWVAVLRMGAKPRDAIPMTAATVRKVG